MAYMLFCDQVRIYNIYGQMIKAILRNASKAKADDLATFIDMYDYMAVLTENLKKNSSKLPLMFEFEFKEPKYF